MRNIALTFLGCFTILAACSNSDDAEKPVTPVPTGDVTIYATTSSLTRDLTVMPLISARKIIWHLLQSH